MKWRKGGLIYAPGGASAWAKKYAFPPTPWFLREGVLRLYVSFCDEKGVGRVGFVDVDSNNPSKILQVSGEPVLDICAPGAFDENGVVPTCVIAIGENLYLYYVGYQLGFKLRYFQFEGLAISHNGGASFARLSRVPIIDRSNSELVNRTSAYVMFDEGVFKMWYVGGSNWTEVKGKLFPMYEIKYLESKDGIKWGPEGKICVPFQSDDEYALGRPWVIKETNFYRMFYSVRTRSKGYRIGYAESKDGHNWARKDHEVGIDISESGWDSQMIAYAGIVKHGDRVYMFYNGNNCGETGFGYAVLEEW